jgi:preprotein translocase subunit SecB
MKPNIQQKIKFLEYKVYDFGFNIALDYIPYKNPLLLDINVNSSINPDNKKGFFVDINLRLTSEDNKNEISISSRGIFESDTEIDIQFLNTSMVQVNAPAILFPFVRAFINTITTNAGYNPLIIPAINFSMIQGHHPQSSPEEKSE